MIECERDANLTPKSAVHDVSDACQKDRERYVENTRYCGRDQFTLRAGDCTSELRYSRISRSEDEFYYPGAAEVEKGHGRPELCDEWLGAGSAGVKKVAADTMIIVTQAVPTPRKRVHSLAAPEKKMAAHPECTASPPSVQAPYSFAMGAPISRQ
ncbi:hypothetical protein HPB50_000307 [Hyalomma asiaticum]|uniref:Uncharacterized protein n=1 Tax=Hyalomma asiaticum TaxID=266040 RepID=A0ACB7RSB9_HYAAI|nr:hypothetical protein HPB50_000307 [Hyalomma asiaticum]